MRQQLPIELHHVWQFMQAACPHLLMRLLRTELITTVLPEYLVNLVFQVKESIEQHSVKAWHQQLAQDSCHHAGSIISLLLGHVSFHELLDDSVDGEVLATCWV